MQQELPLCKRKTYENVGKTCLRPVPAYRRKQPDGLAFKRVAMDALAQPLQQPLRRSLTAARSALPAADFHGRLDNRRAWKAFTESKRMAKLRTRPGSPRICKSLLRVSQKAAVRVPLKSFCKELPQGLSVRAAARALCRSKALRQSCRPCAPIAAANQLRHCSNGLLKARLRGLPLGLLQGCSATANRCGKRPLATTVSPACLITPARERRHGRKQSAARTSTLQAQNL